MLSLIRVAFSNFKFRSLFFRNLLWLTGFITLPVLFMGLLGNWYSQTSINEEVKQSSTQMLEQTRRLMDLLLSQVDQVSIQLAQSKAMSTLLESRNMAELDPELSEVRKYLLDAYINMPYIESIYVYYAGPNKVQTPLSQLMDFDELDDKSWISLVKGGIRKEGQWYVRSYKDPDDSIAPASAQVTFIRPLPLLGTGIKGAVIINMNQPALFQSPSMRLMRKGEEIWVVSPDGNYAFNKAGLRVPPADFEQIKSRIGTDISAFDGKLGVVDYSFTAVNSPYTSWKYIDIMPSESLHTRSINMQRFMFILTGLCMAAAVISAFIMSIRVYSPIYSLMEFIRNRSIIGPLKQALSGRSGELSVIVSAYESLLHKGDSLEQQLAQNKPILQQSFLNSVLFEKTSLHKERAERFAYYGLTLAGYGCFVCVLRIDHYSSFTSAYSQHDQSLIRYFIAKLAEEIAGEYMHAYAIHAESSDIKLLCSLKEPQPRETFMLQSVKLAELICAQVRRHLTVTVSAGIGDIRMEPGHIADSFAEALEALNAKAFKGHESVIPCWISDGDGDQRGVKSLYMQLKDLRKKVPHGMNEEGYSELEISLAELEEQLRVSPGWSFELFQAAMFQIVLDVYNKSVENGLEAFDEERLTLLHASFNQVETAEELLRWTRQYAGETKRLITARLQQQPAAVSTQIAEYIEAHYAYDISLGGIAEQLRLDPSYVSRLFKQEYRMNFSDYLISLRMDKAKELLKNTTLSIKDIGMLVGYENQRSFNRIFKKQEGVSPGQYRDMASPSTLHKGEVY
ncbi:helix-turn-helix domain-containing protein [Paenibacillus thalictri]|nr:helix-turn-helix domain-containing protein [Paenibacillus thalictri]